MQKGGEQKLATDLSPFCWEDLRCKYVEPSINCGALQGQLRLFMQFVRLSIQIDSLNRSRPAQAQKRTPHPPPRLKKSTYVFGVNQTINDMTVDCQWTKSNSKIKWVTKKQKPRLEK